MPTITEVQITEADFQTVQEVVYKHCGISLNDEKQAMVRARLAKQIRAGGFDSAGDYLEATLADRKGEAFVAFIDAITTNLTSFFRESGHFKYLSDVALPALLKRKKESGDGRLLVWSAACSSGEEPYTIAMTILETIHRVRASGQKLDVRILGTDISTQILAKARAGIYDDDRIAKVPAAYRAKYFRRLDEGSDAAPAHAVSPLLRDLIRFRHLNLLDPWPFRGPFDFIFCRNVMIYFDAETQQRLIDRFWHCLSPGGLLFTGHSESLTRITHRFASKLPSIYEKSL